MTITEIIGKTPTGKPLPKGWRWVKLEELFDVKQGVAMSPLRRQGVSLHPFLRTLNILWGKVDLSNLDKMDFTEDELTNLKLKNDDLLVCEGGDVGRTAIWRDELTDCLYQNHIHRLRRKNDNANPDFYKYWMQAAFTVFQSYKGKEITTTIPNLSGGKLKSFIVPLPPTLAEQERIARILNEQISAIEKARAAAEARLEAAKALPAAYLRAVFPKPSQELPDGWKWVMLEDLLYLNDSGIWGIQDLLKGSLVIRSVNFRNNGSISIENLAKIIPNTVNLQNKRLIGGDILLERSGGGPKQPVGRVALFTLDGEYYFGNFITRLRCKSNVDSNFLFLYLHSLHLNGVTILLQDQTTGIRNLRFTEYLRLPIPLPPLAEQERIARILNEQMEAVEKTMRTIQQELDSINALPAALLRRAFTGGL